MLSDGSTVELRAEKRCEERKGEIHKSVDAADTDKIMEQALNRPCFSEL